MLLGGSICAAWIGAPGLAGLAHPGRTLICSLDVGQGDATVIRTRERRWILVDAGPGMAFSTGDRPRRSFSEYRGFLADPRYGDQGRATIVPFLRGRGARHVELFILSHPHLDHFGGSAAVLDRFTVRRVLGAGFAEPSTAYSAFLNRLGEEGALWMPARAGSRLRIDEVEFHILWPPGPSPGGANEHSIAFRLRAPGITYLTTGDAPSTVEEEILARWPRESLTADLLKLGHHGSRTSTSLEWLRAVGPEIALISAGRANRHGHPHPTVLARLDSASVPNVWRTDLQGSLCVEAGAEIGWRILDE